MSELKSETVERIFKHGSENIIDPDPSLSSNQVLKKLSESKPEFINATISGPKYEEGKMVYHISKAAGTKG